MAGLLGELGDAAGGDSESQTTWRDLPDHLMEVSGFVGSA